MSILNLTQHQATADQLAAGMVDLTGQDFVNLKSLLDFKTLPTQEEIYERAYAIAKMAEENGAESVMIGGAPFFMGALERALTKRGIKPLYAFSQRVSVEKEVDGKIVKTAEFKHMGFVEVWV